MCLNLITLCLLTLPFGTLSYPTPTVFGHAATKHASPALHATKKFSPAYGHKNIQMYGYAPGAMMYKKYGGVYGSGLPYGGVGLAGAFGANFGPYGVGPGHHYGKLGGYGVGLLGSKLAAGKLGYDPLYMLSAMKTYSAKAGGYMNPYGMYPTLGKHYNAVATQFPAHLAYGGMYGKYGGGAYMKQPGLALGAYGKGHHPGYLTPYGGKMVGGYGPMAYPGTAVVHAAKQAVPGYGSVNMLGKALTTYG